MKDAKQILESVKQFFADITAPAPMAEPSGTPAAPKEYELKDGGKVTIDKLEPGGVVMIDGAPSAMPGDLELSDGTIVTVGDNGVITEVKPGTPAAPDPSQEMSEKFTALQTLANEKFAAYEQKFAAYEQRFANYEKKIGQFTESMGKLLELATVLAEQPQAPADPSVKVGFKKEEQEPDERTKLLEAAEKALFN